jgi:hypothetical protein
MSNGSPAQSTSSGAMVPYGSRNGAGEKRTPTSNGFGGAFSSFGEGSGVKDHASSIVGNSDLLRQRLSKPSADLTVSKYHVLRKEFLAKYHQDPPERNQLTILHFAFWNPP